MNGSIAEMSMSGAQTIRNRNCRRTRGGSSTEMHMRGLTAGDQSMTHHTSLEGKRQDTPKQMGQHLQLSLSHPTIPQYLPSCTM